MVVVNSRWFGCCLDICGSFLDEGGDGFGAL
jgi:hypothetical protein